MFLRLNAYRLTASRADATVIMLSLASGELSEADFAQWIRDHSARV